MNRQSVSIRGRLRYHVHSCQSASRHALPLRPADRARPASRPAAAGAALPHPGGELLAQGDARPAFRELAAGSERQLAGALRLPGEDRRIQHHGRSSRRYGGGQSVRFLRRAVRRQLPLRLSDGIQRGAGAVPRCRAGGAAAHGVSRLDSARPPEHRRLPGRAQSTPAARHPLSDPHGSRRAHARGDARGGRRLLPRQRVAAGANPAASRSRRAFRVGLSHPAAARRDRARRSGRRDAGFHRSACLGGSVYSGRRLDRARRHVGIAVRGGPSPARGDAAFPRGRADQRRRRAGGGDVLVRHERHAPGREAARDLSVLRRGLGGARRARRQGRRRSGDARRPPDHGRRADIRLGRRLSIGGVEHRCARPDQARPRRRPDPQAARPLCARRAPALRPGQMVSGRAAAALGVRALLAARRQADLARRRAARDRDRRPHASARRRARFRASVIAARARSAEESPRWPLASLASAASADDAQRFTARVAARLGIAGDYVQPAFEDPAERMLKEGELAANIDPSNPNIDDPHERARIMRAFERRLGTPAGYVLPVQRWTAQATPGWISEIWRLRRGRLFVLPGDSPIGFRLPLKSLPYFVPADYPHLVPADPFDERGELVDAAATAPVACLSGPGCRRAADRAGCSHGAGCVRRGGRAGAHHRHSGAYRHDGRAARRAAVRVHAAGRTAGRLSRAARGRRSDRGGAGHAGECGGLRAAAPTRA